MHRLPAALTATACLLAVAGCGSDPAPTAQPSRSASRVADPADRLPPPEERPGDPRPGARRAPASCRAGDLGVTFAARGGGRGVLTLGNRGELECVLTGWIGLALYDAAGKELKVNAEHSAGAAPAPVTIAAGGAGYVAVEYRDAASCPSVPKVRVDLPGRAGRVLVSFAAAGGDLAPVRFCADPVRIGPVSATRPV